MNKEEQSLVQFYSKLGDTDCVRVFQKQEFEWACLQADASTLANIVYKTASAVRKLGSLDLCTVNTTLLKQFLKDALQTHGLRIELYELETGSKSKWKPALLASPGNLQSLERFLEVVHENPVIMACKVGNSATGEKLVGVCFVDAEQQKLGVQQFSDNDMFSSLESTLIQLGVKEILVPESADTSLFQMLEKLDILTTKMKSSNFNNSSEDDFLRLLNVSRMQCSAELEMHLGMDACNACAKYLNLLGSKQNFGNFNRWKHNFNEFMKLDAAALRALNVMPTAKENSKTMSLFGLLNQCKTVAGTRLLATWLKQPLTDIGSINQRLDLVEEFIENSILRSRIREELMPSVPDLQKLTRKFHHKKARLEDVISLYYVAVRLPEFIEELSEVANAGNEDRARAVQSLYIDPLTGANQDLGKLVELVETTVDLKALERHEYVVKPDFDDELVRIEKLRSSTYQEMELELENVNTMLDTDKVKLENNPTLGWAFRLTRTDAGCLRNRTEFIDLKTQKSGQFFTSKKLRALARTHADLGDQYSRSQSAVANEVVNVASTYIPVLPSLGSTLSHLDVLMSFAQVSAFSTNTYVRPTFGERVNLVQARHPCMEVQSDVMFIPNDVCMDRETSQFNIITGPNMGGKSTYIRQVGVIAHMAQLGCFVPCSSAELSIMDCVLARVGASDSQLKGISTFMAEMMETASILKHATPRSLIIIDELGRGTSTYDGFGLAYAISEHIIKSIGSFGLFATHFHELTDLANKYPQVENLHVVAATETSDDDITLLYKVEKGVSNQSFGIHVAEAVHFPDKVIKMAKRKARELEQAVDAGEISQLKSVLHQWKQSLSENDTVETKVSKLRKIYSV